ncbi:hypothetical protein [Nocardia sp. NPDC051463]|uniref:hypothetical protein n=1 Tax=Nocardia sp. NPDC051463 TaxID=3154845 RepID=UPI00344C72C3
MPNPAIRAILLSDEMRNLMQQSAERAQGIYQSIVAKRTGRLAGSAHAETLIGGRRNDRWTGRLVVDAPYAASHEYGTTQGLQAANDLNQVLNLLAQS